MLKEKLGELSLFFLICLLSSATQAEDSLLYKPSTNMTGDIGLNTIPSARMSPEGTSRFSLSRIGKYTHASLGLQINDRFYVGLRQTSESRTLNSETLHLYPGLDTKFRLYSESRFIPEIAVGLQSAFGHKRMAAEYLVFSKRHENIDFTFGLGWGRMATKGSLPNAFMFYRGGTERSRAEDGENPNSISNWFTGEMGLFGGIEYITPISGLSLKTDWNNDGWAAEKRSDVNFNPPSPWSVGLSYRPMSWIDTGIAYTGFDSLMARITLTGNVKSWSMTDSTGHASIRMLPNRPETHFILPEQDEDDDEIENIGFITEENIGLSRIFIDDRTAEATLALKENKSTPYQIGNAARYLSNIAGRSPEKILVHVRSYGLKGVDIALNRRDLERSFLDHQGSPEEIWHSTLFLDDQKTPSFFENLSEMSGTKPDRKFRMNILNDASLSEEDSGLLYRTALGMTYQESFARHFLSFQSLRLNLADNLEKLNDGRERAILPVRSDIDKFTQNRLLIDRNYFMGLTTLHKDLHIASSIGYLEEMYMGLSGEILYRPFDKNWSIGLDTALAFKRDPYTFSALGLNGDHILTGFLNGYYEIPETGATLKASLGRFLAGDVGGSISITNELKNGVRLSAYLSASNQSDRDIYNGRTNMYTGLQLSMPLGSVFFLPDGSRIITNAGPFGRETSQRLENPTNLYERTENLSYRHITRYWPQFSPVQTKGRP